MAIVSIRMDVHPRCDRHSYSVMQPVLIQQQAGSEEPQWFPAYACTESLCHRRYNSGYGYFSVRAGAVERDSDGVVACPQDGLPMYIDAYESGIGLKIWRCSHFGCTAHQAIRGAAHAG